MKKLALFTSIGFGLQVWDKIGTFSREVALYKALARLGWEIHVFTYERHKDISYLLRSQSVTPFKVHTLIPDFFPRSAKVFLLPFLPFMLLRYIGVGRNISIIKTNQGHAAIHALLFAILCRTPLVARSGYILSEQLQNRTDRPVKDIARAWLERITMQYASVCFVPTSYLLKWCQSNIRCRRLELMPNNVDTDIFHPKAASEHGDYVLAVGRVVGMKRYDILSKACAKAGIALKIAGDGPDCERVLKVATESGCRLEMLGRVPNTALPPLMAGAAIYVICSEYEGHPKSLVEAMACGCACIGTDSPGIRNQICDGENGLLAEGTEDGLAGAIRRIVDNDDLMKRIRAGARKYALENFSLEVLAEKESKILAGLCEKTEGKK